MKAIYEFPAPKACAYCRIDCEEVLAEYRKLPVRQYLDMAFRKCLPNCPLKFVEDEE